MLSQVCPVLSYDSVKVMNRNAIILKPSLVNHQRVFFEEWVEPFFQTSM